MINYKKIKKINNNNNNNNNNNKWQKVKMSAGGGIFKKN